MAGLWAMAVLHDRRDHSDTSEQKPELNIHTESAHGNRTNAQSLLPSTLYLSLSVRMVITLLRLLFHDNVNRGRQIA